MNDLVLSRNNFYAYIYLYMWYKYNCTIVGRLHHDSMRTPDVEGGS